MRSENKAITPDQGTVTDIRALLKVPLTTRSSQSIKIGIDKNRQQSSDFYRLITGIGVIIDLFGFNDLQQISAIVVFRHELDSTAKKTLQDYTQDYEEQLISNYENEKCRNC